jgi:hypothetical protein
MPTAAGREHYVQKRKAGLGLIRSDRAIELMRLSIEQASKSIPEDKGIHPSVGAVLADNSGEILAT